MSYITNIMYICICKQYPTPMELMNEVKKIIKAEKVNTTTLSMLFGVSKQQLSNIKSGKSKVRAEQLISLCNAYGYKIVKIETKQK